MNITKPEMAHRAKRRTLRDLYRATIDSLTSALRLANVENELGIKYIEATAADAFQIAMANVTTDPAERQQLRNAALSLGQLGISGFEDVEKMARAYHVMRLYGITMDDIRLLGKLKSAIRNAAQR